MKKCLYILFILTLAMAGCAAPSATPTPTVTLQPALTATRPPPTRTPFPTWLPPSPTPTSTWPAGPVPEPAGRIVLKDELTAWFSLDETHVYWALNSDPRSIFRAPLAGGMAETLAVSHYADGHLATCPFIHSGDWFIFIDTPWSSNHAIWQIRALNLRDGREQVVVEEAGDRNSWPGPWLDAEGDWVAWTQNKQAQISDCSTETMLLMRHLETGEQRTLDHVCAQGNYLLLFPHLSNNYLVYEQDWSDVKGGGHDIYLYDLQAGQRISLTSNHHSSMPGLSYPWVLWKDAQRFGHGPTIVYDLQSGQQHVIQSPSEENNDPQVDGHWLYWLPDYGAPLYVYDLETDQMHLVAAPGPGEVIRRANVYGQQIAWLRHLAADEGQAHEATRDLAIEWGVLPGVSHSAP